MSSILQSLFGQLSARDFVERYFHQLPIAVPEGAKHISALGTLEVLRSTAAHAESRIARSRRGQWWPDDGRPSYDELMRSLTDGWTIFVRHAERFHSELAAMAAGFQRAFQAPIDVHFFCTPAETEGFGWHYDVEDVFILQTHGAKKYKLRKNTVNPWPLVETTPENLCYEAERSLAMECELKAGDWLYIPPGYWHATEAKELSISLSVGVMSPTAIDLLGLLRPMLVESLRWRQRLPLTSELCGQSEAEQREQLRAIFADLGDDLRRRLVEDEFVSRYVEIRRTNPATRSAAPLREDTC